MLRGGPNGGCRAVKALRVDIDWNRQLPIFASERYLRHLAPEYGWLGGVDEAGDLACVLPYVVSLAYQSSKLPYWSSRFVKLGNIFFRNALSLKSHAASFSYSIW